LNEVEESAENLEPLSLRLVIFGGEALEMRSLRGWFERHGDEQPRLVNMYGITETTVHVTYRPLSLADLGRASVIGEAIEDLQVYVLDAHGQPAPLGVSGELFVGGAGVARGYLGRPELTAERFVPDPFSAEPGARLYRSGDLARRLPDGELEYLGRGDRQVKIRGFRIELGEIEAALLAHAEVREAVVTVREDTPDDKKLVAYISAPEANSRTSYRLRKDLRERLPEYMVPSTFVFLNRLPLTPNGKVDVRALAAHGSNGEGSTGASAPKPTASVADLHNWLLSS
jgi:acyl-coenzyme A synthetase/AMP-(fatty) acid ligase